VKHKCKNADEEEALEGIPLYSKRWNHLLPTFNFFHLPLSFLAIQSMPGWLAHYVCQWCSSDELGKNLIISSKMFNPHTILFCDLHREEMKSEVQNEVNCKESQS